MNLTELQKEAHAIAKDHGWWDEERSFGDLIALVHSELSEALEAYREHGDVQPRLKRYNQIDGWSTVLADEHGRQPIGVPSELADVVIRVADMAEWYEWALKIETDIWPLYSPVSSSFGGWIAELHHRVSLAYDNPDKIWRLSRVVTLVQKMAAHYCIDLDAAIETKMEHNRTREYRHGGKAL